MKALALPALSALGYVHATAASPTAAWCEDHVLFSSRVPTAEPGPFRRGTIAALCRPGGPVEALDDPDCELVVAMKAAQTALTTTAYCWLMHEMVVDPASALIVMNSIVDAREKSDETWRPLWEDSPGLREYIPRNRRRDWTKLFQRINGSPVYWIGANSPGRLGAKPIRRLVLDEVDKYPQQTKREAGAAALAMQRVKTFKRKGLAKILMFSTPTTDSGDINVAYEQYDKRKLFVPCRDCGTMQAFKWPQFKIDMKAPAEDAILGAHYECEACGAYWSDQDRWTAIDAGEWRPTAKSSDPRARSFHVPSLVSKFVTHAYLAAQWIAAQRNRSMLQDFINSELAEPYIHADERISDELLAQREGEYDEGQVWLDVQPYRGNDTDAPARCVIAGVDVQKGYLVAAVRAFGTGGDSGLVWAGDVPNLARLDELCEAHGVEWVFVDQRYRTREIQEWCVAHAGYIPCQGVARKARVMFSIDVVDIDEGRTSRSGSGRQIEMLSHDPDLVKSILVAQMTQAPGCRRWMVPRGYGANVEYCKQMTAEQCINGRWVVIGERPNHFFDAEALALLGAIRLQIFASVE